MTSKRGLDMHVGSRKERRRKQRGEVLSELGCHRAKGKCRRQEVGGRRQKDDEAKAGGIGGKWGAN